MPSALRVQHPLLQGLRGVLLNGPVPRAAAASQLCLAHLFLEPSSASPSLAPYYWMPCCPSGVHD